MGSEYGPYQFLSGLGGVRSISRLEWGCIPCLLYLSEITVDSNLLLVRPRAVCIGMIERPKRRNGSGWLQGGATGLYQYCHQNQYVGLQNSNVDILRTSLRFNEGGICLQESCRQFRINLLEGDPALRSTQPCRFQPNDNDSNKNTHIQNL